MAIARKTVALPSPMPELSALEANEMITVNEGAKIVNVHPDTFVKHFRSIIKDVGPRLKRVRRGDVYSAAMRGGAAG
jgi:hypothetical protein